MPVSYTHLDVYKRQALARLCSSKVIIPEEVGCCGFAGDRGFTYPELNAYALRKLRPQIEAAGVSIGYSNSRTCEIGLTTNSGIPYAVSYTHLDVYKRQLLHRRQYRPTI